jgi:hypothetical protein
VIPWKLAFDASLFHAKFVVYNLAVGQFNHQEFLLSLVSILSPILHTDAYLATTFARRTRG